MIIKHYDPIWIVLDNLFNKHAAENAASILVLGLSGLLTLAVLVINSPKDPLRWISCVFLSIFGSAIILTSTSIPDAKLNVEDTLIFFGNLLTASEAFPQIILFLHYPPKSYLMKLVVF